MAQEKRVQGGNGQALEDERVSQDIGFIASRQLPSMWYAIVVCATLVGIGLAINHIFNLQFLGQRMPFYEPYVLFEPSYLYILLGLFLAVAYLLFPMRQADQGVQWYDVAAGLAALGITARFAWVGPDMVLYGWDYTAPTFDTWLGVVLFVLIMEGARRTSGLAFVLMILPLSLYPMYAHWAPGPLEGYSLSFMDTIRYHVFSTQSIMGLPMQVIGNLLFGFLIFGIALAATGAGQFFTNFTMALLGSVRGGTAKVAIVASAAFGMMSGSAISNVLSTGTITIPAMKRTGFQPHVAASVEANASSGGLLMPPVMGATAFLMASVLEIPYLTVAMAAAVPACLYYLSLFLQLDAYAAKYGIQGLPRSELPSVTATLQQGWHYVFSLAALVFCLLYLRQEAFAPFYATVILIGLNMCRRALRWNRTQCGQFIVSVGRLLATIAVLLGAVGTLIGGLNVTGVAASLTSDLMQLAGGNIAALLLLGALASFILGTGLPVTASYIFLAIMMAPALGNLGLNLVAVHLFILYWATLSDITPPVAIAVVAAAGIAGSNVMKSMWESTRLAAVKYALPFFFVLTPSLVFQDAAAPKDELSRVVLSSDFFLNFGTAVGGIATVAYALQGYLPWVGVVAATRYGYALRLFLVVAGMLLAIPHAATLVPGTIAVGGLYGCAVVASRRHWRQLVWPLPETLAVQAALPAMRGPEPLSNPDTAVTE
jgi:TRAP transporter 4TM/12TM fusion protein